MLTTGENDLDGTAKTELKPRHREAPITPSIGQQTAKLPSDVFPGAAGEEKLTGTRDEIFLRRAIDQAKKGDCGFRGMAISVPK